MKTALTLISLAFISSCAPHRLVPYDFTTELNNLQAFVEIDDVTITLENLEIQNDHYVFALGIQNNGTAPVLIDPQKILKFANSLSYQEGSTKTKSQEVVPVMPPEQINQLFEAKHKDAKTTGVLLFILGAAISTYDAVQDAKDNSKEYWTREDQRKSANRDVVTGASLLASGIFSEIAYSNAEKADTELIYLPDELFNKNVIAPGEEYYGKILFKKIDIPQVYHRVTWLIQNNNLLFDFRMATGKEKQFLKKQGY